MTWLHLYGPEKEKKTQDIHKLLSPWRIFFGGIDRLVGNQRRASGGEKVHTLGHYRCTRRRQSAKTSFHSWEKMNGGLVDGRKEKSKCLQLRIMGENGGRKKSSNGRALSFIQPPVDYSPRVFLLYTWLWAVPDGLDDCLTDRPQQILFITPFSCPTPLQTLVLLGSVYTTSSTCVCVWEGFYAGGHNVREEMKEILNHGHLIYI